MIEAYRIAANLSITGDAEKKMQSFAGWAGKAAKHVETLVKLMKPLNTEFAEFSRLMNPISMGFDSLNSGLSGTNRRLTNLTTRAASARTQLNMLATAAGRVKSNLGVGGIGGGGGGRRSTGFIPFVHSAKSMAKFGGAFSAYELLTTGFEQNQSIGRDIIQLQSAGYDPSQIAALQQQTSKAKVGLSPATQFEILKDAIQATTSLDLGKQLAPSLEKSYRILQSSFGDVTSQQIMNLIKFGEMRGGSNPQAISRAIEVGTQLMMLGGGSISAQDLRTFARQGPGTASRLSDLGLLRLEPIIQELGAAKTGTMLTTLRGFLLGGIGMTKTRADMLQKFGILGPVERNKEGQVIGSKWGSIPAKMREQIATDPGGFLFGTLMDAMKKHGVTDFNEQFDMLAMLFPRTPGQGFDLLLKNFEKIMRLSEQSSKLSTLDQMLEQINKIQPGSIQRLTEAWKSLALSVVPEITKGANLLAATFEKLANMINFTNNVLAPVVKDIYHTSPGYRLYNYIESKLNKSNVDLSPNGNKNITIPINLRLGSHEFGKAVLKGMLSANNNFVSNGMTGSNLKQYAFSNDINIFGGGMSQ